MGEKNATVNIVEEINDEDSTNGKDHGSEDTDSIETTNSSTLTPAFKEDNIINIAQTVAPYISHNNNSAAELRPMKFNSPKDNKKSLPIAKDKPIAPLPPTSFQNNTISPCINNKPLVNTNLNQETLIDKIYDNLFEEICDEVIKCDDKAPSVPDVILQVISEILSENHAIASGCSKENISAQSPILKLSSKPHFVNIIESDSSKSKIDKNNANNTLNNDIPKNVNTMSPINTSIKSLSIKNDIKEIANNNSVNMSLSASSSQQNSPNLKSNKLNNTSKNNVEKTQTQSTNNKLPSSMNRNRTRKTITKTFTIDGQTQTIKKTVNTEEEERQRQIAEERRRDLIEHRRNLNEDRRKLIEQTRKQDSEKESLEQDFKEQKDKLLREFEIKLAQIHQFRKAEIERCEEAQAIELKTTLKRIRSEQDKALKCQRDQLKEEFKLFKRELESNSNHLLMSKEHRDMHKKQKEKELLKREEEFHLGQQAEINEEVFFKFYSSYLIIQ